METPFQLQRNAFLAFVRHFNESAARSAALKCP